MKNSHGKVATKPKIASSGLNCGAAKIAAPISKTPICRIARFIRDVVILIENLWQSRIEHVSLSHVETPLQFFIAGAIQGSRQGTFGMDQEYRSSLRKIILARYPDATVICPLVLLKERFSKREDEARTDFERETADDILNAKNYGPVVTDIRAAFSELTQLASQADVLIAYLPKHEASMGTAMEIWSAYSNNRPVITITSMTRNLSLIATSNVILPSLESFEGFLNNGGLSELL